MTASQATALWSALVEELTDLQAALIAAETVWASQIELVDPENHASAVNLAHYWALRQYDLRDLQGRLAELGLSSPQRDPHPDGRPREQEDLANAAAAFLAADSTGLRAYRGTT